MSEPKLGKVAALSREELKALAKKARDRLKASTEESDAMLARVVSLGMKQAGAYAFKAAMSA